MTQEQVRRQFPELSEKVYKKNLVYLDNAATAQRSENVIAKWIEMSSKYNSNLHRAVHRIAGIATEEYENTRRSVAEYIAAESPKEIVFTSGTTQSINLVAFSFGERFVSEGDEILVAESEHHSDIVPWQMLCERKNALLKVIPIDENGKLKIDSLESLITKKTRLVCVAHISNVLGLVVPVKKIVEICHSKNVPVLIDGAQGIVHCPVNVKDLDCDFYVFSGHKMYAAPGTGILYGKKKWLEQMPPYMGGGEMIETVKWNKTSFAGVPQKFEAGTQNIAGVPTLVPAIEIAKEMENFKQETEKIKAFVYESLLSVDGLHMWGRTDNLEEKVPVFSITVDGAHHEDLALILDKMGIAVRSGQMCAEPLMDRCGVTGMLRASFAPYNNMGEAEYFIDSLHRAIKMLR